MGWANILLTGNIVVSGPIICSPQRCPLAVWLYLGTPQTPPWSTLPGMPLAAYLRRDRKHPRVLSKLVMVPTPPSDALLLVSSSPILPVVTPPAPLPEAAYHLPLAGSLLARLFPPETRLILRVRIFAARSCSPSEPGLCPDGMLLSS